MGSHGRGHTWERGRVAHRHVVHVEEEHAGRAVRVDERAVVPLSTRWPPAEPYEPNGGGQAALGERRVR
eukprot:7390402-Prymnesium_polylepis.1